MPEVVYFELNNWAQGRDYPDAEPFLTWMEDDLDIPFGDPNWAKENKLCGVCGLIDMSQNFCITATKEWVKANCPSLLTEYIKFLRYPDEDGEVQGQFGHWFLEYKEENFGITLVYDD